MFKRLGGKDGHGKLSASITVECGKSLEPNGQGSGRERREGEVTAHRVTARGKDEVANRGRMEAHTISMHEHTLLPDMCT